MNKEDKLSFRREGGFPIFLATFMVLCLALVGGGKSSLLRDLSLKDMIDD